MLLINVGSANQIKVDAVKELLSQYRVLSEAHVHFTEIPSGVSEQPMSLEETICGARNRAFAAEKVVREFLYDGRGNAYDFGIGIESGFMQVPFSKTGLMNVCVCVVHDGREDYMGLSSAFEFPPCVMKLVEKEGLTVNQASQKAGLTTEAKIGSKEGAIGLLTKGRLTRKDYIKQAVMMALIQVENPGLYSVSLAK